jgi:hypothetical protein
MDTLEFLRTVLPEDGVKIVGVLSTEWKGMRHYPYASLEDMAEAILELDKDPTLSVYHACSTFSEECITDEKGEKATRVGELAVKAKSFWLDLDCGPTKGAPDEKGVIKGYFTQKLAAEALKDLCSKVGLPFPMVVSSGNGLHCYWPLTKAIPTATWRTIATIFKDITLASGIITDPTATADRARVLRPIGTMNKKDEHKPVRLIRSIEPMEPKAFAKIVLDYQAKIQLKVELPKSPSINDDLIAHIAPLDIPTYADIVAEKCGQVAAMRDSQGNVSYEQWRGVIGIIKYCKEGADKAHEWSQGHPQYDAQDTQQKFDTWNTPPTTCEFFSKCNPNGCEGCAFKGKIKTPLVLGRKAPEGIKAEVDAKENGKDIKVQVPEFPSGYIFENGKLTRLLKDKDDIMQPHVFCSNLFYPLHRIRKENGDFSLGLRMHLPDKRTREFEIDTQCLASPQKLIENLARFELVTANSKDASMHMTAYLRDSLEKLKREAEELNTYTNFGWQDEYQSFLVGDRLYCSDGTTRKVLVGGYAKDKYKHYFPEPIGSVEGYAGAIDFMYNREGMEPLQYALGSGFGSILTPFGDPLYKGLLFMLGDEGSGQGKTTVTWANLYAWGDANALTIKGPEGATLNARYAMAGVLGNIPFCMDELTHMPVDDYSKLAYTMSLGQERERLTTGRGPGTRFAESQSWALTAYGTGNKDFFSLLASGQSNTEAEAVRILQIKMKDYRPPSLDISAVQLAIQKMTLNRGRAGEAFAKYCVQNLDTVIDKIAAWAPRVEQLMPDVRWRMYRNHVMKTMAALEIAKEVGIVSFDLDHLYNSFVVPWLLKTISYVDETNVVTAEDALHRMLNDLSPRILVTTEYRDGRDSRGPEDVRMINGAAAGRRILGNSSTKNDPLSGKMYIVKKEIMDWCLKQRVDYKNLVTDAIGRGVATEPRDKFNVGRGTRIAAGQHKCIEFDMFKLEAQGANTSKLTVHTGSKLEGSQVVNN